jgi:uncharacterized membrane protein
LEFELLGAAALFTGVLMSGRKVALGPPQLHSPTVSPQFRLPSSRRFALAAVFGAVIFTSKVFAPTPVKDSVIVVQALLLGLGALLLTPFGATLVATIGGLLTASWNPNLAVFTLTFAALYGVLIDSTIWALKARTSRIEVRAKRFTAAITLSTAAIGLVAYATTIILGLLPRNPVAEVFILAGGIVSGLVGGYLAVLVWRRAAKHLAV